MSDAVAERTTLPTVFEWQADAIEKTASIVAFWTTGMPEERLSWKPKAEGEDSKSRCIYDQLHECAQVNRRFANILKGAENGAWVENHSYASASQAAEDLKSSATELAGVIRGLEDAALTREYQSGMGPMTGANLMSIALTNMSYHGGQINQIQLLYGDTEFRFPGKE